MPDLTAFALSVGPEPAAEIAAWPFADAAPASAVAESVGARGLTAALRSPAGGGTAASEGRFVIFAGELYNQAELLAGLVDLPERAPADVEIVAALIEQYGPRAPAFLNGRFAGAVVERDRVLLFTDHAGTVPLYLAVSGAGLAVATEAKALVRGAGVAGGVRALFELRAGLPSVSTPFHGVSRVPNGSCMVLGGGGEIEAVESHYAFPRHRAAPRPGAGEEYLLDLLRTAVERRVGASRRVATVLSGGVDSSAVTALAVEVGAEVLTLTIGTPDGDEFAEARLVAEALGTEHREVRLEDGELLAALPHAVWAAEVAEPRFVEYLLPLHSVLAEVEPGVDRVLTGYGADIAMGGMVDPGAPAGAREEIVIADLLSTEGSNEFSPAVGASHTVWTTHPFWDREVLTYLASLPAAVQGRNGVEKHLFRSSVTDLIPAQAAWRPKLGIHESTGLIRAFDQLLIREGSRPEEVSVDKEVVVHRVLKILYEDGATPSEIDVEAVVGLAAA